MAEMAMNTIVLMVMVGHASAGMQATTIPPSLASSKGLLAARMSMDGGSILRLRGGVGEPGGGVVQIDSKEAWDEILTKGLVVCDFYATWCGPCHKISPKFEEYSYEFPEVNFCKVDVDANAETATACGVTCMPTFQMFYNGAMTEQLMGADPVKLKEAIKNFIKRVRVLQGKEENAAAAAAL